MLLGCIYRSAMVLSYRDLVAGILWQNGDISQSIKVGGNPGNLEIGRTA